MNRIHLLKSTAKEIINLATKSEVLADSKSKIFCSNYLDLNKFYSNDKTKIELFSYLCQHYGLKLDRMHSIVSSNISQLTKQEFEKNFTKIQYEKLKNQFKPDYYDLFKSLARVQNGVQTLVKLREDIIDIIEKNSGHDQELRVMNSVLKELLTLWFSVGLLKLQRVTWESPAVLVEKIAHFENVHPIRSLSDLKTRLGTSRRCYIFTHSTMPTEPLIILHIALTHSISSNIVGLLKNLDNDSNNVHLESNATHAIFYSISSSQKGLKSVDLGNSLIKSCVTRLQEEVPTLKQFHTLSPVPGFRAWLNSKLDDDKNDFFNVKNFFNPKHMTLVFAKLDANEVNFTEKLKFYLSSNEFQQMIFHQRHVDDQLEAIFKEFFLHACAFYLYNEKHRGFALNSVTNFHLKNGAYINRLNFAADLTDNGWKSSFGLMVNYGYDLDKLNSNCLSYLMDKKVSISDSFEKFLVVSKK